MKRRFNFLPRILFVLLLYLLGCNNKKDSVKSKEQADSVKTNKEILTSAPPNDTSKNNRHVYYEEMRMDEPVEKKIDNLLVFHTQDTMEQNMSYKATLALSKKETLEKIKEEVINSTGTDKGKFYVDSTLKIASTMKAVLKDPETGGKNFEISLIGDGTEVQDIDSVSDYKAFWQWSVKPLKEGKHQLELVIEIVVNKTRKIFLPSRTISITIYSKPESFGEKLAGFFARNWQWMIGAVMIPFAIAWFNHRSTSRASSKKKAGSKKS